MRGEFMGVWSETWREIWLPLVSQDGVSDDIYCELYRELVPALKIPSGAAAVGLVMCDAIQLREAFDRALILAGVEIDLAQRDKAFDSALSLSAGDPMKESGAAAKALTTIIKDPTQSQHCLTQALGELIADPQKRKEAWARRTESVINDKGSSEQSLQSTDPSELNGERALVAFFEAVHSVLDDLGGDSLSNSYFTLLATLIEKFSLRYDLRRPCQLCPTLPGVFAGLVRELRMLTAGDAHLDALMKDFENAIRDLRADSSEGKIKTCIQKQVNLLEALGRACPGVTRNTLAAICDQLPSWPHAEVKDSIKSLYGFASDYPGIRHAGTPAHALRAVDMRDLIAISVLLSGFTPYLAHKMQPDAVYRGT